MAVGSCRHALQCQLGNASEDLILDVEVHVKFLIALPLLAVAELVVHQRMRTVTSTFGERHMVTPFDLGNSFEIVRGMRIIPVAKEAVFQLGVATLAPLVPLVLTMMPLEDLLKKLLGVIF